jgi:hypothetical protein
LNISNSLIFSFTSLIKPVFVNNRYSKNFIFFKFSMILIVWLKYLNNFFNSNFIKTKFLYFFKKNLFFSFSKAPMAHKTRSHEKYKIQFYNIYLLYKINNHSIRIKSINTLLIIILKLNNLVLNFDTNLIKLSSINLKILFNNNVELTYK